MADMVSRRRFIGGSLAAAGAALLPRFAAGSAVLSDVFPRWRPGELELHFIHTGCGENCFYILPDGTTILNDTGDFYRPENVREIPLLPSAERLGGEWVARYISRVWPEKTIDYLIFSHWHTDHIGSMDIGQKPSPKAGWRFRDFGDGLRANGFRCVAREFSFRRYLDHQYPSWGAYNSHDRMSLELVKRWLQAEKPKGLAVEPFRVGALDQIALLHAPEKYKGVFSIRNLCANGVAWDGAEGRCDFAAEHAATAKDGRVNQNTLSSAFVIRYGRFAYYAGGDVSGWLKRADGTKVDYEAEIGKLAGPVTVCKMNHHGCPDAMSEGFVRAVRAKAYVACVWDPWQLSSGKTLARLTSRAIHEGRDPVVVPTLLTAANAEKFAGQPFGANIPAETRHGVHVAVKVAPGGGESTMYLIDARDESMRVVRRIGLPA